MACNPQKAKLNTERPAIRKTYIRAIRTRSYKEERPTACNQLKGSPVKHHVNASALSHYDSIARRCREILGPCAVPESPSRETDCAELTRGARVVNIAIVYRPRGTSIGGRRNRLSEEPFGFSFGFLGRPP